MPIPAENEIIAAFRTGDYDTAIRQFARRPPTRRSAGLHEAAILACAQVPDAEAAQAVLRAMSHPTLPAVANVCNALCRQRDIASAVRVLYDAIGADVPVDARLVATVSRAADRIKVPLEITKALRRLSDELTSVREKVVPQSLSILPVSDINEESGGESDRTDEERSLAEAPGTPTGDTIVPNTSNTRGTRRSRQIRRRRRLFSAAGFFVEYGEEAAQWPEPRRGSGRPRTSAYAILQAERHLRAARGDIDEIQALWEKVAVDELVSGEVGPLAAAVDAFLASDGGGHAVHAIRQWIRDEENISAVRESAAAEALLLTTLSKTLGATAEKHAYEALVVRDAAAELNIPRFHASLPLTGAYFKVLQHAALPLDETAQRIAEARRGHIQLDEPAFSMGLGALLRCDARVADKLDAAREWLSEMGSAGIPVSVRSFNLLAGQIRYCHDAAAVSQLLSDMAASKVVPTAVTYGLCFSACVIPAAYDSPARRHALPVSAWHSVLAALQDHMVHTGVQHSSYSRFALARAFAHLGEAVAARNNFARFRRLLAQEEQSESGSYYARNRRTYLPHAFSQIMYNLAHCRLAGADALRASLAVHDDLVATGLPAHGPRVLEALIVAHVRLGDAASAIRVTTDFDPNTPLSETGFVHLFQALAKLREPSAWDDVRTMVAANTNIAAEPQARAAVQHAVLEFARSSDEAHRNVCRDVVSVLGIDVPNLDLVRSGRDFLRLRRGKVSWSQSDT